MDITKIPKQFCESISVAFSPEFFVLMAQTGGQGTAYALTPQHTKRLSQYLAYQLSLYEKQYGEVKAEWSPNIKSPITISDLKSPPTSGDAPSSGGKKKK